MQPVGFGGGDRVCRIGRLIEGFDPLGAGVFSRLGNTDVCNPPEPSTVHRESRRRLGVIRPWQLQLDEGPCLSSNCPAVWRSLPIKCLLRDGLVHSETSFLDYGCGDGQNLEPLPGSGIPCDGWDPAFRAEGEKKPADVVNLGYVINVIEDTREREEAVRSAWALSNKLLVVAAQIEFAAPDKEHASFADGVITGRGTF